MSVQDKIKGANATWVFVAPVSGVMTEAGSFKLIRTTFIKSRALPRFAKKFGFTKPISELATDDNGLSKFFRAKETVISLRLTGAGHEKEIEALRLCEEELFILAFSQLIRRDRLLNSIPALKAQPRFGTASYLLLNSNDNSWIQNNYSSGFVSNLVINSDWKRQQKRFHFDRLIKILRGDIYVSQSWRDTLYGAAIIGGVSQCSGDLTEAFLWNMIAIEMLISPDNEKHADAIPDRLCSLFDWSPLWNSNEFGKKIQDAYDKRCKIVHHGRRNLVQPEDLWVSDTVLLNLISTLVRYHKLFSGRSQVKAFAERRRAEKILGIRKSKVRPKGMRFTMRTFSEPCYRLK